jgi:hypothetical protein
MLLISPIRVQGSILYGVGDIRGITVKGLLLRAFMYYIVLYCITRLVTRHISIKTNYCRFDEIVGADVTLRVIIRVTLVSLVLVLVLAVDERMKLEAFRCSYQYARTCPTYS